MAVNVAVLHNFVPVEGRQMAVIFVRCGSEAVLGSGNTGYAVPALQHHKK
jgi:hypothetical protein